MAYKVEIKMEKFKELSLPKNKRRIEKWGELGIDTVRADVIEGSGGRYVGGGPENRRLARLWIAYKDSEIARECEENIEPKWYKNPWVVGVGTGLIVAIVLALFGLFF
jgi:hypothetical protein